MFLCSVDIYLWVHPVSHCRRTLLISMVCCCMSVGWTHMHTSIYIQTSCYWMFLTSVTIITGLINAIAWPSSLISLASVIDNPWGVCCRRSAEVGKQLAEVLLSREQGQRPVTLIGFSLGARVIYYCLRVRMFCPNYLHHVGLSFVFSVVTYTHSVNQKVRQTDCRLWNKS